jgi:hypothetical protein
MCAAPLPAGTEAVWDVTTRTFTCTSCIGGSVTISSGTAGASARAKGDGQHAAQLRQRQARRERRPILGRLANAFDGPPTAGHSYLRGAVGEEKLGAVLDRLVDQGLLVLHDRRRPRTTANIDHLVVAPSGVWVIDAKRYKGLVTRENKGRWFTTDMRLMVDGRDRTSLVNGVHKQTGDVEAILGRSGMTGVPVHGVLCFIDAEFHLFAKPFTIDDVVVTWGKALREHMAAAPGPIDVEQRAAIHRLLAVSLPPAG